MTVTLESTATPDGKISCELICKFNYGSNVYSVHVYETHDHSEYVETHRSCSIGNKQQAASMYKRYCNQYLRNRSKNNKLNKNK